MTGLWEDCSSVNCTNSSLVCDPDTNLCKGEWEPLSAPPPPPQPPLTKLQTGMLPGRGGGLTWRHLSVKIYIDQSNMVNIQGKQMHVAYCEYSLGLKKRKKKKKKKKVFHDRPYVLGPTLQFLSPFWKKKKIKIKRLFTYRTFLCMYILDKIKWKCQNS